jgi:predicted nucleic acid-binding protein
VTVQVVVDSCVAVKWVVREEDSDKAIELLSRDLQLIAPDFVLLEIANVLWKNVKRGLLAADGASARLADVPGFFNKLVSTPELVMDAFALGDAIDVPVYDCAYVVAARRAGARLVTADSKLVAKLAGTADADRIVHLSSWN